MTIIEQIKNCRGLQYNWNNTRKVSVPDSTIDKALEIAQFEVFFNLDMGCYQTSAGTLLLDWEDSTFEVCASLEIGDTEYSFITWATWSVYSENDNMRSLIGPLSELTIEKFHEMVNLYNECKKECK
jgi:hypothetical protein